MPTPSGLKFTDRIAPYGKGHYVQCKRRGHKKLLKYVRGFRKDAKLVLDAHDAKMHNPLLAFPDATPSVEIDELCEDWLLKVEKLEVAGKRDPQTVRHYHLTCDYITRGFRAIGVRWVREIDPPALSEFVDWMRRHSKSAGSLIVKTISSLKTMIRKRGLPVHWQIPHDEIRPAKRTKKDLDASTIKQLVAAMPVGSMEEAMAYLKARTGARDVEIFKAKKEEFDLDVSIEFEDRVVRVGIFRPILRNKGKVATKRHVYVITSDAAEKVRPFVERASAGGYVFRDAAGNPVTRESMRPRIMAAAKKAGFIKEKKDALKRKPPKVGAIDSLAQIRAEVITQVTEELSIEEATKHSGHTDTTTPERWYVKDRMTRRKLAEKFRPAEVIAHALPLR